MREIDIDRRAQQPHHRVEVIFDFGRRGWRNRQQPAIQRWMIAQPRQLFGDPLRRQNKVHAAGIHRTVRHPVVFRGVVLRERDAPFPFDGLQAQRSIGGGSRQNHAHRPALPRDGHPARRPHGPKEFRERFQSTGRGTNPNHGKRSRVSLTHRC